MEVQVKGTKLCFDEATLHFSVEKNGEVWNWAEGYTPKMICRKAAADCMEVLFASAGSVTHRIVENGIGKGIESVYSGFSQRGSSQSESCCDRSNQDEGVANYVFATYVWIEAATENVFFEWIPLAEEGLAVEQVIWPGPMAFEEKRSDWYTLLTEQQGILLPNDWETEWTKPAFNGFFETSGGYMPWFGQVRGAGYIAICVTPWNAGYQAEHPAGGPYTHVGIRLEPSLGRMEYRRIVRYTFLDNCDYNDLCKVYRHFTKENGTFRTLAEKAAKTPSVNDLIGCAFVHEGIKTVVQPESAFFDPEAPEKNNHLTTFAAREQEIRHFHELGVEKLYLHLDGWAQPGYDNNHPDYMPACAEAGGWEGMKSLVDHMHEWGYLFGIHDQYRDYYRSADSFSEEYACRLVDGTIPEHHQWAGGHQSYLCGTQAPFYVRRNFSELAANGIRLDGAYLDVFTCNEGDECSNPMHRMTRRECYEYRGKCFEYLLSNGILPSSEEVSDWSIGSLVFCHYAPYDFMMKKPGTPKQGIPVPLYNLVYHDCVIIPWMMEKVSENEDYMLYALINGGAPYLVRDGAYPNIDGAFAVEDTDGTPEEIAARKAAFTAAEQKLREDITRCKVVSKLHEKIAKCELVRHELLTVDGQRQRSVFADGTTVTVDFKDGTYEIAEG